MTDERTPTPIPPTRPAAGPDAWDRDAWRGHGRYRCHVHHHHHRGHGVIPGLVIIAWGGLLLAREYGWIDPSLHALDFWPLILVGVGLGMVLRPSSLGGAIVGLALGVFGASLLAERLGYALGGLVHLWPVLVVIAGVGLVVKGLTRRRIASGPASETSSADELRRSVTMGGLELAVDSQRFRGGAISATMGGVELDLRRAGMAGDQAVLEVSLFMSGLELYVPPSWRVANEITPFMGGVEEKNTVLPDAAGVQRTLVLRGSITMGAITVQN